jgi:hypothetical protein
MHEKIQSIEFYCSETTAIIFDAVFLCDIVCTLIPLPPNHHYEYFDICSPLILSVLPLCLWTSNKQAGYFKKQRHKCPLTLRRLWVRQSFFRAPSAGHKPTWDPLLCLPANLEKKGQGTAACSPMHPCTKDAEDSAMAHL